MMPGLHVEPSPRLQVQLARLRAAIGDPSARQPGAPPPTAPAAPDVPALLAAYEAQREVCLGDPDDREAAATLDLLADQIAALYVGPTGDLVGASEWLP
jgi:hypothetical protein